MGLFDRLRNLREKNKTEKFEMITQRMGNFFGFRGRFYESDIIRAAIRPKARAIGKATATHISYDYKENKQQVDTKSSVQYLLQYPNDYMTGQMLQEKLIVQLELNNNAFAYIQRDGTIPTQIYPIDCSSFEILQDESDELYLKFFMPDGRTWIAQYKNIIHLRKDYATDPFIGTPPGRALTDLMDIVSISDQGLINAVKNSGLLRWLLVFNNALKPKDLQANAKEFAESYVSTSSETGGVAAVGANADVRQLKTDDYVPNAYQSSKTIERVYNFFNTNAKIVSSSYTEDEWISYFEAAIEPDLIQMSNEFTRRLFSPKELSYGNKIIFASNNLTFASMQTKLNLVQLVDRGILTPNEVRDVLGYAPAEGGDEMVRRLDTAPTGGSE